MKRVKREPFVPYLRTRADRVWDSVNRDTLWRLGSYDLDARDKDDYGYHVTDGDSKRRRGFITMVAVMDRFQDVTALDHLVRRYHRQYGCQYHLDDESTMGAELVDAICHNKPEQIIELANLQYPLAQYRAALAKTEKDATYWEWLLGAAQFIPEASALATEMFREQGNLLMVRKCLLQTLEFSWGANYVGGISSEKAKELLNEYDTLGENPLALPFAGRWKPEYHYLHWRPIKQEMCTWLLVGNRLALPKELVMHILAYMNTPRSHKYKNALF